MLTKRLILLNLGKMTRTTHLFDTGYPPGEPVGIQRDTRTRQRWSRWNSGARRNLGLLSRAPKRASPISFLRNDKPNPTSPLPSPPPPISTGPSPLFLLLSPGTLPSLPPLSTDALSSSSSPSRLTPFLLPVDNRFLFLRTTTRVPRPHLLWIQRVYWGLKRFYWGLTYHTCLWASELFGNWGQSQWWLLPWTFPQDDSKYAKLREDLGNSVGCDVWLLTEDVWHFTRAYLDFR